MKIFLPSGYFLAPYHAGHCHLKTTNDCDVLIIGAGLAGLSVALSLPANLHILVLSKDKLEACSSYYAQGGIAAAIDDKDSVDDHVADTAVAGDGLCNIKNTTSILSEGKQAIAWLQKMHVPFTTLSQYNTINNVDLDDKSPIALHLTKEGGHGCRRVAHAEDATGKHIMQTLLYKIKNAPNITLLTFSQALQLQTQSTATGTKCTGALVYCRQTQKLKFIQAKSTVIASGGLGPLFKRASAPDVCVGDGILMAWQAGCRLANLEFIQFHPTGLAFKDSRFLISEALRGEGAYLRCPNTHQRFMHQYDKRLELAPRDVVARAIADQIQKNKKGYVYLDISHQSADFIKQHFPQIHTHLLQLGIDMTNQPIPVAPTAHYTCGGIITDDVGHTDVINLYAAGEAAYTGLHGANRLASNSLLECVVMGRRIAKDLLHQDNVEGQTWSKPSLHLDQLAILNTQDNGKDHTNSTLICSKRQNNHPQVQQLKSLLNENLGISRHETSLKLALATVNQWLISLKQQNIFGDLTKYINSNESKDCTPNFNSASATQQDIDLWQWQQMLILARILLVSALKRQESRGGHYRQDYPTTDDKPSISIISPNQRVNTTHLTTAVDLKCS